MKALIVAIALTGSVFANTADVTCDISGTITVEGTFGNTTFNQAQLDFNDISKESPQRATLVMNDRFGTSYETFYRLYPETFRCNSNSTCISTDFSNLRGLSFSFPNSIFEMNNHNFTMRVRSNRSHRSHFAHCRSTLR